MIKILRENADKTKQISPECLIGATILSVSEAETMFSRKQRKCQYNGEPCGWWLRPDNNCNYVSSVFRDGDIINNESPGYENIGIRPVLILDDSNVKLNIGDYFTFDKYRFTVYSKNLAICKEIIGLSAFEKNKGYYAKVDYQGSDVKQFVDNWFDKSKDNLQIFGDVFNDDFDF